MGEGDNDYFNVTYFRGILRPAGIYIFSVLMRNFFKVIVAISIITLALMILLDKAYSYSFQNGQARSKIQYIFQLENKNFDVAFFGSSRTENHIDCTLITRLTGKSCINFGIGGGSPGDMLILMKLAKDRNIEFKKVFMQVDYNYNSSGTTKYFEANLIPFIDNPVVKKQFSKENAKLNYSKLPFYRYMLSNKVIGIREAVASVLHLGRKSYIENGFVPRYGIGNELAGKFPSKIKDTNQEFEEMQKLYNNSATELEFFTTPYCPRIENRSFFMSGIEKNIPGLHNYIELFDNKEEYFANCGHMNETGAAAFCRILVKDLLETDNYQ